MTCGTPTKKVPVNSSSDSRKTKMALAMMPGAASGRVMVAKVRKRRGADVARRELEVAVDGGEGRGGDPDRVDEAVRGVDQHDAGDGAGKPDLVEDARDVDVDRDRREGLRQEERDHDQRAGRQLQPCKGIAGRHRDEERDEHGKPGDGDARRERRHGVPGRAEHHLPIAQAVGDRQLERRVPALGDRPQREIRERAEQREGEERKGKGFRGVSRGSSARSWGAQLLSPLAGRGLCAGGRKASPKGEGEGPGGHAAPLPRPLTRSPSASRPLPASRGEGERTALGLHAPASRRTWWRR